MYQKKERKGLIKLRKQGSGKDTPKYHCDNCGCDRYSPCGCQKKNK